MQPEFEGAFVPVGNDCGVPDNVYSGAATKLLRYFEGPKHMGTGATRGLDDKDADAVDAVLQEFGLADAFAVDRSMLSASHEAWVFVSVLGDGRFGLFEGFAPYPRRGVLTWPNSD
jgi:hypothetical protein